MTPLATPIELSHAEREACELNNMLAARKRGDTAAERAHWERIRELHWQRPAGVVEAMERGRGLT